MPASLCLLQVPPPVIRDVDRCGREDRSVMAVVVGWAVFSLRAVAIKVRSRIKQVCPPRHVLPRPAYIRL